MKQLILFTIILCPVFLASCDKDDDYTAPTPVIQSTVIKAFGDEADIAAQVDQFRALLGAPLNTTPVQSTGRREVSWDGAPSALTSNNNFPFDFFNLTDPAGANGRKRGLVYLDKGSPFRLDSSSFTEIDATYADELIAFSKKKSICAGASGYIRKNFMNTKFVDSINELQYGGSPMSPSIARKVLNKMK